jgi:Leucine-rich repeat (LRR) protein
LEELDCPSNQLTSLNISSCFNLKKINCSNNSIRTLDLSTCTKLEEINCVHNSYLEELDVSNLFKLTTIGSNLVRGEKGKLVKSGPQITPVHENDIRNILIVGMTGSGKSTLTNVLFNKNSNFEEVFEESRGSTGKTKEFKREEFEANGVKYRIVEP